MTQPSVNGYTDDKSSQEIKEPDLDAQTLVIDSLRCQIQDLFSQVSQLNNKLVKSYDRVSDLEDQLHDSSNTIRSSSIKISQLELERTQHLSALNSGLLVERSHVTTELTRLMEKATEEAARRGQAESARAEIEKELDDLSAGLFGQANSMVAEARLARARSERKVEETERALKGAEEAIAAMQHQMQGLQGEKEETTRQLQDIRVTMGKGKWVDRPIHQDLDSSKRLISSHAQYRDFLYFVSYLREQHQKSSAQIPAMTVLLSHSFLSRLQTEDSDPTIRLDLAPSLNWLTRKSVLSAIHLGQLDIEPVSSEVLLQELNAAQSMIPGLNNGSHISCALCGTFIFSDSSSYSTSKPLSYSARQTNGYSYSNWSNSILKNPLVNSIAGSVMNTPSQSPTQARPPPSHVYIFRLAADATRMIQASSQNRAATMYPLCSSGWCLTRLRAACTLWAFVRTSVVEKVWEEPLVPQRLLVEKQKQIEPPPQVPSVDESNRKPSLPPRRSRIGMFWERAASLGKGDMDNMQKTAEQVMKVEESDASKSLPSTPPLHPVLSSPKTRKVPPPLGAPIPRSVPPPLTASSKTMSVPPPLPARNRGRGQTQGTETPRTSVDDQSASKQNGINSSIPEGSSQAIRRSSEDSFTSATDIPRTSSPVLSTSPRSPSAIPLPDSRPETPIIHLESKPINLVSPKDQEAAAGMPSVTPPPLPRRAAARAQPLSTVVHSLAPPLTNVGATEQGSEFVQASVAENAVEVTPVVTDGAKPVNGDDEKNTEEKVQAEDRLVDNAVSGVSAAYGDEVTNPEVVGNDLSNDENVNQIVVNGIAINTITDQDLVGDNTWEERTWKDLVKLREDMFWARIGGLR